MRGWSWRARPRNSFPASGNTWRRGAGFTAPRLCDSAQPQPPRGRGLRSLRDGLKVERESHARPSWRMTMTRVQKIVLSSSRDIPFNKLVLSQSNVRRIKAGVSIEELAEDIARRTLLLSLTVRPVHDADGVETGMFEVPGRWTPLSGARVPGQAEALGQDRARAVRRARGGHPRGRQPRRKRPARTAASARPVPGFPGTARKRPVRGGHRRGLLRRRVGRQAATAPRVGLAQAARRLCRRRHSPRPAHGIHRQRRPRASGTGIRASEPDLLQT